MVTLSCIVVRRCIKSMHPDNCVVYSIKIMWYGRVLDVRILVQPSIINNAFVMYVTSIVETIPNSFLVAFIPVRATTGKVCILKTL